MKDIEIAQAAKMRPIIELAEERLGIAAENLEPYGHYKAKIDLDYLNKLPDRPESKLILVTAMTPTPTGEGKTTTTVGLGDALNRIGERASICLREPSLGPCFGMKGGAAGGGYAQAVPMEDINLHFTGDFHAVGAANNLLAALIDNHVYWENRLNIDVRRISWRRVIDMNDRALRQITSSLGGVANGYPRTDGFDITVASEVMAVLCLAQDLGDLRRKLGNIVIGQTKDRQFVHAKELKAAGAMTALLKDALKPNLVQTLEKNPVFIHGGPFANIAHGCNSLIATKAALKLSDYVLTEAGFGADLGAEKFFNIKCRKSGLTPDLAVVVATARALKFHGGVGRDELNDQNVQALEKGFANLGRHLQNIKKFGVSAVVAINRFPSDTNAEIKKIKDLCEDFGAEAYECNHWAEGGAGAEKLAQSIVARLSDGSSPSNFSPLYPDNMPLWEKIQTVAREIYGADKAIADQSVRNQIKSLEESCGHYPICFAKTQYSFSTDAKLKGAPGRHVVPIREVYAAKGAEFIIIVCGDIMRMPGLPRTPAANRIEIDNRGRISGLF